MMITGMDCDLCHDAPTACGYLKEHPPSEVSGQEPDKTIPPSPELYLTDIHHLAEITSHPEPDDLLDENYKTNTISSFFCTAQDCDILDPHSHTNQAFSHRTLEIEHYKRLIE